MEKQAFREIYTDYLNNKLELNRYEKIGIICFTIVVAGFVGWLFEVLLAFFETGQFHMRGGNFLPWINLYAIGALAVIPATRKIKQSPLLVFLVSTLVVGAVELAAGWFVYTTGNGMRYWYYDHGPLAVGSINGFVSPLSASAFGVLAVILIYLVLPSAIHLAKRIPKRAFLTLMLAIFMLVMVDEVGGLLVKSMGKSSAVDFYQSRGIEY